MNRLWIFSPKTSSDQCHYLLYLVDFNLSAFISAASLIWLIFALSRTKRELICFSSDNLFTSTFLHDSDKTPENDNLVKLQEDVVD